MLAIGIISTLISSIALIGVVVSLLLQARLLHAEQLQTTRNAQLELIKLTVERPELVKAGMSPVEEYLTAQQAFFNWRVKYLELGYSLKVISLQSVRIQAAKMFESKQCCDWLAQFSATYQMEAAARREYQFCEAVDAEYNRNCSAAS